MDLWYIDSYSSRHMTGNKLLFTSLIECNKRKATFGTIANGFGKSTIDYIDMPNFENVYMLQV